VIFLSTDTGLMSMGTDYPTGFIICFMDGTIGRRRAWPVEYHYPMKWNVWTNNRYVSVDTYGVHEGYVTMEGDLKCCWDKEEWFDVV